MTISVLLEMAASVDGDATALVSGDTRISRARLAELADAGAAHILESGAQHVAYVGTGGAVLPVALFASARAGVAFTPLNYRLAADALAALLARLPDVLVIADTDYLDVVDAASARAILTSEDLLSADTVGEDRALPVVDPEATAVVLFTSGTTSEPKAVELSHNNLTGYVMGTVEFASAQPQDAVLICVPPYHIAGVGAALSNLYAGRRMVYLPDFDAAQWVRLAADERITNATVVPTMLDRIVEALHRSDETLPHLQTFAYGGSRVPQPLVRATMTRLPHVGLVNAYGLTETSSTIAVLGPDDHRQAAASADPSVAARLGSVGRAVPGIELEVRDAHGNVLAPGQTGELFVRGAQVSGRYTGLGSVLDADGWFPTRDVAMIDGDGYLFIGGRSDDTIIRGGENIAPAEIEDVLVEHPAVAEAVVVGVDDDTWGQAIVAVVVPRSDPETLETAQTVDTEDIRQFVRARLRGSRTPDRVVLVERLPATATGKILRRQVVDELTAITQGGR